MKLYIRNQDKSTTEIFDVNAVTFYPKPEGLIGPEIVVHFLAKLHERGQENIPLAEIHSVTVFKENK